ncbi:glycosyltransferase family 4 protein [Patescibacteria group bacterium]|nr:glycosyltransferase family 4 protein [Patescibacteria group bacterium]
MRILVLNHEFPPVGGGASPVSFGLAEYYAKAGHEVSVVTMAFSDLPEKQKVNEKLTIFRVTPGRKHKEKSKMSEHITYIQRGYAMCKHLHREKQFDVCHTHFALPGGILALRLKNKLGLPYILSVHGSDVPGHNPGFNTIHTIMSSLTKRVFSNARNVTYPSRSLKDIVIKLYPSLSNKSVTIANGSKDYYREAIKEENIVIFVGRLQNIKRVDVLIEAFKRANNSHWKLYIIGDGPEKENLKANSEGKENIIFTGWMSNESNEYTELLNKAKIFCSLSSTESQGIALVEAMSAGCALVVSNIDAHRETTDKSTAVFINGEKIDEARKAIQWLIDNPSECRKKGSNARQMYKERFIWDTISPRYLDLFT